MCMGGYVNIDIGTDRAQKRVLVPGNWSYNLVWSQGIKLWSSTRTANTLNCRVVPPAFISSFIMWV